VAVPLAQRTLFLSSIQVPGGNMKSKRMIVWLFITVICMALATLGVAYSSGELTATHDMGLLTRIVAHLSTAIWKLGLISLAAYAGYWIDATVAPYARPDMFLAETWKQEEMPIVAPANAVPFAASLLRRAIIMGACMIGVAMGA
jgi:hypothetical protein